MANVGRSRDAVASMCDMYRENRCLWDTKDLNYYKKTLQRDGGEGHEERVSQQNEVALTSLCYMLSFYRHRGQERVQKVSKRTY